MTLPQPLRRKYGIAEGDLFTITDLGDGSFLFTPDASQVARLGDEVARLVAAEDATLDDLLEVLDQEREAYYRERYADAPPLSGQ